MLRPHWQSRWQPLADTSARPRRRPKATGSVTVPVPALEGAGHPSRSVWLAQERPGGCRLDHVNNLTRRDCRTSRVATGSPPRGGSARFRQLPAASAGPNLTRPGSDMRGWSLRAGPNVVGPQGHRVTCTEPASDPEALASGSVPGKAAKVFSSSSDWTQDRLGEQAYPLHDARIVFTPLCSPSRRGLRKVEAAQARPQAGASQPPSAQCKRPSVTP